MYVVLWYRKWWPCLWQVVIFHLQVVKTRAEGSDDVIAKAGQGDAGNTTLDISFDDTKPLRKKPVLEESFDRTQTSEKEGGEGGSGDNTILEFSFDDESSVKPRKKRPVLSSTKNPPKRRSKKGEGEEEGEKKVEEVEEPPKSKPPAKKVLLK